MSYEVRRFISDEVLASGLGTQEAAEQFVDDYVTEHGGILMIEEEPDEDQDRSEGRSVAAQRPRT